VPFSIGNLHQDFESGDKKLTPMIFCHGGGAPADEHMALPMQMASHGFLVVSPDFMEG